MIGALFALGGALSWGASQIISKAGVAHTSVTRFVLIRALVGLTCMLTYGFLTSGFTLPEISLIGWAMLAGALDFVLGTMLFVLALKRIQAHEAASLANSAPLWGVVGAWIVLGEPFSFTVLVAALLVVAGAYLLTSRNGRRDTGTSTTGFAMALGAGVSWGVAETVPAKYCLSQGMDAATFQLIMLCTATLLLVIVHTISRMKGSAPAPTRKGTVTAILSGFLGFFLGWVFWLRGVDLSPASLVAPLRGATIIFAFAGSAVFLKERPTGRALVGMLLIVSGVVFVLLSAG